MTVQYNVVLGCPRSGTTFLMRCLNALPYSECITGHLVPLSVIHTLNQPIDDEIYHALSRGFEFSLQDYLGSKFGDSRVTAISRWLKQCMGIQELFQTFQRKRQVERVIYKEPFLSFVPEFTYHALPNSRIVHIYRDGRDSADSQVRSYNVLTDESLKQLNTSEVFFGRPYDDRYVPWWVELDQDQIFMQSSPFVRAIWMWNYMLKRCHQFFSQPEVLTSGRVLLLRYEDLVEDPVTYGQKVVEHFGGTMNDRLVHKFQQARRSSVGIHRHQRSPAEIEQAEVVAQDALKLYGYL